MNSLFYNLNFDIFPIGLVLLVIPISILLYKRRSFYYIISVTIFCIYLVYGVQQVLFPIEVNGDFSQYLRESYGDTIWSSINYMPFYFGEFGTFQNSLRTSLLNILLTIPFGFGLNFITYVRFKHSLWIAPLVGLSIEVVQLGVSLLLGYPHRLVDINDVIMNAIGVLIGFCIFLIFAKSYIWITHKLDIEHEGLGAYIHERLETSLKI